MYCFSFSFFKLTLNGIMNGNAKAHTDVAGASALPEDHPLHAVEVAAKLAAAIVCAGAERETRHLEPRYFHSP